MSVTMTPGGAGAELNVRSWNRKIEPALYQKMQFIPTLSETTKVMDGLYVRRLRPVAAQSLASTNDGTSFNLSDFDPVLYVLLPNWVLAAGGYSDASKWRQGDEIDPAFANNLNSALAVGLDTLVLAEIAVATATPIGDATYHIEAAGLRNALGALETNSKRHVTAGVTKLNLLLSTGEIPHSLSIPEINNAYQRGDGKSPTVSGRISTGLGFNFDFATHLVADGNGRHGAAYHGDCIQYGYNKRPAAERQRLRKQTILMADAEIGFETIYQEKLQPIRHAA